MFMRSGGIVIESIHGYRCLTLVLILGFFFFLYRSTYFPMTFFHDRFRAVDFPFWSSGSNSSDFGGCVVGPDVARCGRRIQPLVRGSFQPQQASLTFYGRPKEMGVSWVTFDGAGNDHYLEIRGTKSLDDAAGARPFPNVTFPSSCHAFLPRPDDCRFILLHAVNVTGLTPGTDYAYRLVNGDAWRDFRFRAAPPNDVDGRGFLLFADVGLAREGGKIQSWLAKEATSVHYDAILSNGDFAYDLDDIIDASTIKADVFKREMEPVASLVPFMTVPGNHEKGRDPRGPYYQYAWRFRNPGIESGVWPDEPFRPRYSLDFGRNLHVVFVNTASFFGDFGGDAEVAEGVEWLRRDLSAAVARDPSPWIVLLGHVTPYCHSTSEIALKFLCEGSIDPINPVRRAIEPVLTEFGVHLAIWGDVHLYERTYPVRENRRARRKGENVTFRSYEDPAATTHVVNAVGGTRWPSDPFRIEGDSLRDWSAFRSRDHGFGRLLVLNATHLRYEQISVDECDVVEDLRLAAPCVERKKPKIIDWFWIIRRKGGTGGGGGGGKRTTGR